MRWCQSQSEESGMPTLYYKAGTSLSQLKFKSIFPPIIFEDKHHNFVVKTVRKYGAAEIGYCGVHCTYFTLYIVQNFVSLPTGSQIPKLVPYGLLICKTIKSSGNQHSIRPMLRRTICGGRRLGNGATDCEMYWLFKLETSFFLVCKRRAL